MSSSSQKSRMLAGVTVGVFSLLLTVLATVHFIFPGSTASALTANDRSGPNIDWFNNRARYVLEDDAQVDGAGTVRIPVYVLSTNASEAANSVPPTNVRVQVHDVNSPDFAGGNRANFSIYRGATGGTLCTSNAANNVQSNTNITINRNCFTYLPSLNGWVTFVNATLRPGSGIDKAISFRMTIITPDTGNELIGYAATNGAKAFAIMTQSRCNAVGGPGCGRFYNYAIPFGTPCSVTSNTRVSAGIFDGDNNTSSGPVSIQYNRLFSVQIYDVTAGAIIPHTTTGSEGGNAQASYTFTAVPRHKYEFRINNVYANNVLQFSLPYNSIESIIDCGNWSLRPSVTLDGSIVEPGSTGHVVTPAVNNTGAARSDMVSWEVTRCIVNSGAPASQYSAIPDGTQTARQAYNALGARCGPAPVSTGSNEFGRGISSNFATLNNETIPDEPVGTRICYILSVSPPSSSAAAGVWRHSDPSNSCYIVSKKPKVQVLGGDLIVGRATAYNPAATSEVQTSVSYSVGTGGYYGSWSEYAIIASGQVTGMASGSAYVGGAPTRALCSLSLLTISNNTGGGCQDTQVGNYNHPAAAPNVVSRFPVTAGNVIGGSSVNLYSLTPGRAYSVAQSDINVSSSQPFGDNGAGKGRWVVINDPDATVTITSNLNYTTATLNDIGDIPQIVIIAKNIIIAPGVTNVDAWLIAVGTGSDGYINTCGSVPVGAPTSATVNASTCASPLVVNGPMMTNKLYMYRTYGSGTGPNTGIPAEVFNLRADAYIWASVYSPGIGRIPTVSTQELPPKY